ncbi:MAG: STAS/SEC14 domain-containing protein [Chloracidobacterium sp.]|nr:STAS/SEC14 domain-containing protein [Chloracidobacterium sp.]
MGFNLQITVLPDHLRILNTGEFSLPALFEFIGQVKSEAEKAGRNAVLVDSRGITGNISEVDRFMGGQHSAEVFGTRLKVAILMPVGSVTKMAELAAVNRGARMLVTDSEAEALDWLLN